MKRKPVDELVYETLFPRPSASDPSSFQAFLTRHLVYEVRQEVHAFYGHIDDLESKYPGLDYCNPIHRIRLGRWPWHRRLFRTFDGLKLTQSEIYSLTKWEGTKWAKERYEREQNIVIRDTTADSIGDWVEPKDRVVGAARSQPEAVADLPGDAELRRQQQVDEDVSESEDEVESSVGVELNERLRRRVAAHNAGDTSQPLDEEWEQWLKNAIETGELGHLANELSRMSTRPVPRTPDDIFPERMLNAARSGRWHEVPEFLQDMIRRSLDRQPVEHASSPAPAAVSGAGPAPALVAPLSPPPDSPGSGNGSGWRPRRTFSGLRLPDGPSPSTPASALRMQPTARAPGA